LYFLESEVSASHCGVAVMYFHQRLTPATTAETNNITFTKP
jgi:hypothetical protein